MKKCTWLFLVAAISLIAAWPHTLRADPVQLPCSDDCGPVRIPGDNPPAPDPGTAPGHPIEAPDPPNPDPIAPNEPPPPSE